MARKGAKPKQARQKFDDSALENLTSRIDKNLTGKPTDNKRKQPPTAAREDTTKSKKPKKSETTDSQKDGKISDAALLEEIKALGGDESDLALINGVESDDEVFSKDTGKTTDKKLKDELIAFSKQLGLADHAPSEASEEEDEVEDDEGSDVDDEEDEEEADESENEDDLQNLKGKEKAKAGNLVRVVRRRGELSDG